MKKIKSFIALMVVSLPALLSGCGTTGAGENAEGGGGGLFGAIPMWVIWVVLGVLVVGFFFLSGSRRKKQAQEGQNMLNSVRPGVYVMTQGGVIGKVVEIIVISPTEKHVVLETGSEENKSFIKYDIRAVLTVLRPEQLVPRAPVEEAVMPTDEEVQKRMEEVHSAPADIAEGDKAAEETAVDENPADENAEPEVKII